ncbi:MAG TPA: hypothetical protein VNB86_12165 [Gaiellaceae bacterium]|jgi:hypothetical protein|nr:hypothetical protein [Gaiellaceae bacterium]
MASRIASFGAAALLLAIGAVYLVAVEHGEGSDAAVIVPALLAAAALAGAAPFSSRRVGLLGASFALVLVVAVLTGFSIGLLLVPPLVLLLYAAFV